MNLGRLREAASRVSRPKRMRDFLAHASVGPQTTILDIGGTADFWEGRDLAITVLNTAPLHGEPTARMSYVAADATQLPFDDDAFDVAFSNSTIEHLHTRENQVRAAAEAMRVGRALWIQTPNRWFPIEPHYLAPFVHWLPVRIRRRILRYATLWGWLARPSQAEVDAMVDEIRLLSAADLRAMFPGCEIRRERFLGLTKSLIVTR
jgi:SAM-dependent methyltransferase